MAGKADTPDAVALLKADHRKVETLFEQFEKARSDDRKAALVQEICTELMVHATIEEEIFYPAVTGKIEEDTVNEAYVEHDGAKQLIAELIEGSPEDQFYDAKVKVLSEEIKHHVHEEEMRVEGMFAQAREAGVDMDGLGERLAQRKAELMAEFETRGLPTPTTRAMQGVQLQVGAPLETA